MCVCACVRVWVCVCACGYTLCTVLQNMRTLLVCVRMWPEFDVCACVCLCVCVYVRTQVMGCLNWNLSSPTSLKFMHTFFVEAKVR